MAEVRIIRNASGDERYLADFWCEWDGTFSWFLDYSEVPGALPLYLTRGPWSTVLHPMKIELGGHSYIVWQER